MKYIITEEQLHRVQTKNPESIIKSIYLLAKTIDMEGVCELEARYDDNENNFKCYIIIDRDWWKGTMLEKGAKNEKIHEYAKELKGKINNYLGINLHVGNYVNPLPCEE
jgi:flagellar motor component MotA